MSKIGQPGAWWKGILLGMNQEINILKAEMDGKDGLLVSFSDGTTGGYVVEELLSMRPIREAIKTPVNTYKPVIIGGRE